MSNKAQQRDHGGNLDAAISRFGGEFAEWLDLSTGINPEPYPVPKLPASSWSDLPRASGMRRLRDAAAKAYGTESTVVPLNGAQGAIQIVPWLAAPGEAAILTPTYNEHSAALRAGGWNVREVAAVASAAGADLAVVVNPNNPDGRRVAPDALLSLSEQVGLLVVDESFCDAEPDLSLAARLKGGAGNIVVLRSFGKFYGLAGLRLGFALADGNVADRISEFAGPWPVSGPAIEIARRALVDGDWQAATRERCARDADRLDALALQAGWRLVGGTTLFRTYETPDARAAQEALARHKVWSRILPYSESWIRLGLPPSAHWGQLEEALADV